MNDFEIAPVGLIAGELAGHTEVANAEEDFGEETPDNKKIGKLKSRIAGFTIKPKTNETTM